MPVVTIFGSGTQCSAGLFTFHNAAGTRISGRASSELVTSMRRAGWFGRYDRRDLSTLYCSRVTSGGCASNMYAAVSASGCVSKLWCNATAPPALSSGSAYPCVPSGPWIISVPTAAAGSMCASPQSHSFALPVASSRMLVGLKSQ